jgi:glucuronate isomerase
MQGGIGMGTQHEPLVSAERCFSGDARQRGLARELYDGVRDLPIISPHGHVAPALLADPAARFGSPSELLVTPDHYLLRMLYSQGVALEDLGVAPRDGGRYERDARRIWQTFAEHFQLFRGTPSGLWLNAELQDVFGISERLNGESAQRIYERIAAQLARPEFTPRALFARFNIALLSTTDAATDSLELHAALQRDGLPVRPTFRPDSLLALDNPQWPALLTRLSDLSGVSVGSYRQFISAIERRRAAFKAAGAFATDHGVEQPTTAALSAGEAEALFERALCGNADRRDVQRFTAHMLIEFARMSVEDGLVMQLHAGSLRNHNQALFERFGPDIGADIPLSTEWTRNLQPLLQRFGNDNRLRLILFTLDEGSYSRELAPLAGHYPALRLGPPWWFFDSVAGMRRYFDQVVETAGLYNTAGFNDDTRAFASIPARHDVWRRVACDWLAGQVGAGLIAAADAPELADELAVGLALRAYRLPAALGARVAALKEITA